MSRLRFALLNLRTDDQCEICLSQGCPPSLGRYADALRYAICAPCSRDVQDEYETVPGSVEVVIKWRQAVADLRHYEAGGTRSSYLAEIADRESRELLKVVRPILDRRIAEARARREAETQEPSK